MQSGICTKHGDGASAYYSCTTQDAANSLYHRLKDQCEYIVSPGGMATTEVDEVGGGYIVQVHCSNANGSYTQTPL
jgi:hypothetical protein